MIDEDLRQKISLLVDDQLPTSDALALFERMRTDRELSALYSRYLLASASLRSPEAAVGHPGLAERVHRALAAEPTVLVPGWRRAKTRETALSVALAAVLAGVAVMVGKSVVEQPAGIESSRFVAQAGDSSAERADPKLNNYLVTHNETSYIAANGGLLPYLRVVSYGKSGR